MTLTLFTSARGWLRGAMLTGAVLTLASCAGEVDDTTGSRFSQPPQGSPIAPAVPAGDITIVGQEVGHAILDLPEIANAAVPPLVQFTGVTSIIKSPTPIDTEPYTDLLRDRLLLITRLKLRFIEHTLPAYVSPTKKTKKKSAEPTTPVQNTTNPDYEILAELRGRYDAETYRIQVQFVNAHTNDVLFNGLYTIRKEGATDNNTYSSGSDQIPPPTDNTVPPPSQPTSPDASPPDPYRQAPAGNSSGIQ